MAKFVADICRREKKPCVINGKAYKPSVPYTIGSPSILLAHYLEQQGIEVMYADKETGDNVDKEIDCVTLMAHDPQTTFNHTGRHYEQKLYFKPVLGNTIVDPWRCYVNPNYNVIYYGTSR